MKRIRLKSLLITCIILFSGYFQGSFGQTTRTWTAYSFRPDGSSGTYTSPVTADGMTLYASSSKNVEIQDHKATVAGVYFQKRIKMNGSSSWDGNTPTGRVCAFNVTGPTKITAILGASSSTRDIYVDEGSRDNRLAEFLGVTTDGGSYEAIYSGTTPTTIYIYSRSSGIYIFRVKAELLPPTLTVDATPMVFYYQVNFGPSISKITSVSGNYLTGNIIITPPSNFEISLDNINFQSTPITLSQTDGTVGLNAIYVHMKSGLEEGNYSGEIQVSSDGATTKTISCTGTVGLAPELPKLVINEIFADPGSSGDSPIPTDLPYLGDANGDGIVSATDDQFIEIYNNSATKVNVGTYKIKVNGVTKHIFPTGSYIPAFGVVVVFGGGTPTGFPVGVATVASTGGLGLSPTGSTITITTNNGQVINEQTISYGTEGDNSTSLTRDPEGSGSFVLHSSIGPNYLVFSPGASNNGTFYSPNPAVPVSWKWIVAVFGLVAIFVVVRKIRLL